MTDTETITSAILMGSAAIGGAIKLATTQLTKTQDRGTAALIKSAESNATLAAKFDGLTTRFEALTARFDHFVEILLANGIGLSPSMKLGRAPTAPLPIIRTLPDPFEDE